MTRFLLLPNFHSYSVGLDDQLLQSKLVFLLVLVAEMLALADFDLAKMIPRVEKYMNISSVVSSHTVIRFAIILCLVSI